MSCCAPGAEMALDLGSAASVLPSSQEIRLASRSLGDDLRQTDLSVPMVHCAACIRTIETALAKLDNVEGARVNLSTKRVAVRWRGDKVPPFVASLGRLGYEAHLFAAEIDKNDKTLAELIRAVAVAGFAAGNIMLLSVSVWSGAEGATRDLFHWVSALIAIPALAFAGGIFFRSAWNALRHGRMNMDVPIAVGVSLAYAMSLYETINHGDHAYFDASVSLLFFLLIGRTLDHVMRERARTAVKGLSQLAARGAMVLRGDGARHYLPVGEIEPGMRLLIAAGERIPVDGKIIQGASDLDCSLASGESTPKNVAPGEVVQAGVLNLTGPLTIEAMAAVKDSFLAEMVRLMEAAEGGRAHYRRIADRVSALYAPMVHLTAFVTFLGWIVATGDWHRATTIAIAVLIITCPCALGLAVPIVQVVAARRLFENGIMVKDGSAMERLASVDIAVFDKTGTLTLGQPRLVNAGSIDPGMLAVAGGMAAHSRHPFSKAIAGFAIPGGQLKFDAVTEHPGFGIEATDAGSTWRLGRRGWAGWKTRTGGEGKHGYGGTVLTRNGMIAACFVFEDALRADARAAIDQLSDAGVPVEMLSGDTAAACAEVAKSLGVDDFVPCLLPSGKLERIETLAKVGHKVLMVGDGLNDTPALSAAHVSIAPATAADVGRNAADFVFLRESLLAVPLALDISRKAGNLIRQNIAIAIVYNAVAVPIAISGHVTPLIAAIAMSASSLLVIGNALRLEGFVRHTPAETVADDRHSNNGGWAQL
ncbi:copper/silver-translocating P-type ATPase,heavy metal-translocating P-type ATPase, Cd/Co/Hg/Pb/Zn-transporting [Mesorhizobium australicum WSM2073]|uniref:Copper/silver-translocating P-type ATPase,heavy metal-translocating P-type ATPase, Cd/Co/Hg/Pb/Zn-transporting n=3 Tax=Mesorhizobium TaxID=68287 RepID=L0KR20_MESAW|nr:MULTISPECIES: cation-translocating P-type ATPase [Mesorhizobium]ADV14601.1 copper-translocating P-type ATPase [Mesorhizobium ciceri biovar biserrulae WSM1271]AEH90487.1 heavy metal translocating P-type ATPase [Mesorhizobium opportunistum WSM2075]AGB47857.1 copper/silver-translocating P-type ATPase,heavy metal-translocating P-type ATPase, Cd/Co/Hg/Pb/Zn-transporting [Mesorhizobium australicum WSM2073]OBP90035.1 nitrogen fixation protein FixI [Mesorhizobium loti]